MPSQLRSLGSMDDREAVGDRGADASGGAGADKDPRFVLLKTRLASPVVAVAPVIQEPSTAPLQGEAAGEGQQGGVANPDQHKAFRLLETVRDFIPQIVRENDLLRQNIYELKSQAEAEIEAAERQMREWKTSADALQTRVDTLESVVLDLRSKLQRAESVAAIEKELSSKASREMAEAECLAKLFEDTVIASFGVGTMFEDALTRIATTASP